MDDVKQTSYCTVLDKSSQTKYLCYTRRKTGTFSISLTDAADVWSTELTTEDSLQQFRHRFVLKSPEEYVLQLRSACVNGEVSVLVKDSSVQLQGLTLNRLEDQQATHELKRLLFTMAESLPHTHSTCVSPSVSPVKIHQRRPAEFEPRQQNGSPSGPVKKRLVGASLINPGTKRKLIATGVAFDDVEED